MRALLILTAAALAVPAYAEAPAPRTFNLYDHCMMHAAIRASRTDARNEDIYRLAKGSCVATRASVVRMHAADPKYLAAFNATDAQRARNFPSWIKTMRERRVAYAAERAAPAERD